MKDIHKNTNTNQKLKKFPDEEIELQNQSLAEELSGKLAKQQEEDKLMSSVMRNDKKVIDDGKLIVDAINRSSGAFHPDLFFEQMVRNFSLVQKLEGPTIIKGVTGYDPDYIDRNIKIPEFQRDLKQRMESRISALKNQGLLDKSGSITEEGLRLASLILYVEELDHLLAKGTLGEWEQKKANPAGLVEDVRMFRKHDPYKDISVPGTIKVAARRGHTRLTTTDIRTVIRKGKGEISVLLAIDASGSMKGDKLATCKKAGIALAFQAIQKRDKVGLIIFGDDIRVSIPPTTQFMELLNEITRIRANKQTNLTITIERAIELFAPHNHTKHLIILSDALPTVGKDPEQQAVQAAEIAVNHGITISIVGINLDKEGLLLGEKITSVGKGRLYAVRNLGEIDKLVLDDYRSIKQG